MEDLMQMGRSDDEPAAAPSEARGWRPREEAADPAVLAEALEQQRRRLEMAVEATGLGLWEWDLRTDRLAWSDRNRKLFGLPPDAPVTIKAYLAQVHPDDVEPLRRAYEGARAAAGGGDFALEHRIVRPDGEVRWILAHGRVTVDEDGPKLVVGTNLDVTDRRRDEERRKLMMGELAHRSKNGLLVMMAMVRQAAQSAGSVGEMEAVLTSRIQAMAASQELLTATGGRSVRLGDLLDELLPMFDADRFEIEDACRGIEMRGETAVGVALLLHELGTNAVKHGALSAPGGRVTITAFTTDVGERAFEWREAGGPPVRPPSRRGFGSRLLESALRDRGGEVDSSFEADGFRARVVLRAWE